VARRRVTGRDAAMLARTAHSLTHSVSHYRAGRTDEREDSSGAPENG